MTEEEETQAQGAIRHYEAKIDSIRHYRVKINAYLMYYGPTPPGLVHETETTKFYALPPDLVRPNVWSGPSCRCGCVGPNAWEILAIPNGRGDWYTVHDDAWYTSSSLPAFQAIS